MPVKRDGVDAVPLDVALEDGRLRQPRQALADAARAGVAHPVDHLEVVDARREEIDRTIAGKLAQGWSLERLDRPMRQILRAGTYELLARADVPIGSVISEYVDVAHAFYDKRETSFVNGLLDAVAKVVRS